MDTAVEVWTPEHRELWARIEAHRLDDPAAGFPFSAKLRRQTGWNAAQAEAAIREYRRYCFLATACGHTVAPSPAVDEVWHLHLLYTRDYWEVFCGRVLRAALHHQPANGRSELDAQLRRDYTETLHSYQAFFGPPDASLWPPRRTWFRAATPFNAWRRLRLRWSAATAGLLALLTGSAHALPLDPLEWQGPDFLVLYIGLFVGLLIFARVRRRFLRRIDQAARPDAQLSAWEAAYLVGEGQRVVDAAVAELHEQGVIRFDAAQNKLQVHRQDAALGSPLQEIARHLQSQGEVSARAARNASWLNGIRRSLEQKRLLLDDARRDAIARAGALPMLLLTGFGVAKIVLGVGRDRPVGFLVALTLIAAVASMVFWFRRPRLSLAGDAWIASARKRYQATVLAPRDRQLAMAVALVGTAVLADTALAGYHQMRALPGADAGTSYDASSSSSSSSSSDSSSGDSSGGGCGGCGGGGGD